MSRYEDLKEKLKACKKTVATTMIVFNNPFLIEKMIRPDLDFLVIDGEHGCFDTQNAIPMLHTCRLLGMPSIMRVQDSQYHLITKAIDMGADGVMIPRMETLEQMRTVIDAVRFGPIGRKGAGGHGLFRAGESFEHFQKDRIIIFQVESPLGIQNLPVILDSYADQVDAILIGPSDLSVMLGTPFDCQSSIMESSVLRVLDTSKQYGKSCGIFCNNAQEAKHYAGMGANVLWVASDQHFYCRGFAETLDELSTISI